jgi:ankyrin repeat protein
VKDFVGQAVQNYPQASLAWAGVCVLLPMFTNPSAADKANIGGVAYVASKMRWYCALEELLLPKNTGPSPDDFANKLREEFGNHVLALYNLVLKFQMKSVRQYYGSQIRNLSRDIVASDEWEHMVSSIKEQEIALHSKAQQINTEKSLSELRGINEQSEAALGIFNGLFSFAHEQLSVAKEQLSIAKKLRDVSVQHVKRSTRLEQQEMPDKEEIDSQLFSGTDYKSYKNNIEPPIEGTCRWFLTQKHYRDWLEQPSGILLVSADPGCGKSVLAKYLIDTQLPRSATICYFFFKDQVQNNAKRALCALLHQLFSQKDSLIQHARQAVERCGNNLRTLFNELWSILITAAADPQAGEIICVLDALDECEQSDMEQLTAALTKYFTSSSGRSSKLKFLLTSRPHDNVVVTPFESLLSDPQYIRIAGEDEDASKLISIEVNAVIQKNVETLAKEQSLEPALADRLQELLLEVKHRTHLWVYLVFNSLKNHRFEQTTTGIQDAIKNLPKTTKDAYEEILQRTLNLDKSRKILSIIIAARRPLTLVEINIALEVTPLCRSAKDLVIGSESDFKEAIQRCCGLLVSVHHNQAYPIHQTAREFLIHRLSNEETHPEERNRTVTQPQTFKELPLPTKLEANIHFIPLEEAHRVLAESCVTYLSFDNFDSGACKTKEDFERRLQMNPLYEYASTNWGYHVRSAFMETKPAVLNFLGSGAKVSASAQAMTVATGPPWKDSFVHEFQPIIGVQLATYFSLCEAIEILIDNGQHPDVGKYTSNAPLFLAAQQGIVAVVKLLLEKGANPNVKDNYNRMPLLTSIATGNTAVVKLLLDKGANPNTKDSHGWTPVTEAASHGHVEVVKLLLEKGANPNTKASNGWTPLFTAATKGNVAVVKILLENNANPDITGGYYGETPLLEATKQGHVAVVKLLLEHGADPNIKDDNGVTPLFTAAAKGDVVTVELLLKKGGHPDTKDNNEHTPLLKAASQGNTAILELLLENGGYPDITDSYGNTPLMAAAEQGEVAVVELLLKKGSNPNITNNSNETALFQAAAKGNLAAVKVLLEQSVDPDAKDNKDRTPLLKAEANGHVAVVKLLLESGSDPNSQDYCDWTPLLEAASQGHVEVVKSMLEKGGDPNITDNEGATPLFNAAENGHVAVVKLLIQNGAHLETQYGYDGTPLLEAVTEGHVKVVELLLQAGTDPDVPGEDGETPLSLARELEDEAMIELLLAFGAK